MRKIAIGLIAIVALTSACTRKPMIEPTYPGFEPELTSTLQWRKLAAETADQMMASLAQMHDVPGTGHIVGQSAVPMTMASRPIYVALNDRAPTPAPFLRGFREMLNAELVARGYAVATDRGTSGAVIVNTWTQVVPFDPVLRYRPGTLTVAAGAGYLAHQAEWHWSAATAAAVAVPLAILADAYLYLTDTPNAEVIITTAVVDETRYLFQKTSVYYVDLGDAVTLYASASPAIPAPIPTRRPGPIAAPPVVTVSLVGPAAEPRRPRMMRAPPPAAPQEEEQ